MTAVDPDATLGMMRQAMLRWERAPVGSVAEDESVRDLHQQFARLDAHLSAGGDPPRAWVHSRPPGSIASIYQDVERIEPETEQAPA